MVKEKQFQVVIKLDDQKKAITTGDEAHCMDICREYGWEWEDDDGVIWSMDYEEIQL